MQDDVFYKILSEELQKSCTQAQGELALTRDPIKIAEISGKTNGLNDFVRRVFNRVQMAAYVSN